MKSMRKQAEVLFYRIKWNKRPFLVPHWGNLNNHSCKFIVQKDEKNYIDLINKAIKNRNKNCRIQQ